jgi:glycosyltransferase involved in cell wall biosynthesis
MKIAVLAPTTIPARSANTIQVMKMAQAFASLGLSVDVFFPGNAFRDDSAGSGWEQLAGHYGLRYRFSIFGLAARPGARKYDYAWRALRRAKQSGADIVYTRLLQAAAFGSLSGFPTILELHDLPSGKTGPALLRLFLRGLGTRRLVLISNALLADLAQRFNLPAGEDCVLVVPDGVDLDRYADLPVPAQARRVIAPALQPVLGSTGPGFESDRFTVGYAGHLYPGRGVELIIELAARMPDFNFLLMGGEPQEVVRYRQMVAQRGLVNLFLTGFIPNADLPGYQAACEVLLMPYQHRVAGSSGGNIARYLSPLKLFEYLACGRAILSSDLPVLREVLSERNAVLLPPDDPERWEAAIRQLHDDMGRRLALGSAARQEAGKYSWEARAARILAGQPGVPEHLQPGSQA